MVQPQNGAHPHTSKSQDTATNSDTEQVQNFHNSNLAFIKLGHSLSPQIVKNYYLRACLFYFFDLINQFITF